MTSPQSERLALYGALYLDRGEQMTKVHEQIESLKGEVIAQRVRPGGFFFDVIFRPGQDETAKRITKEIEDAIHDAFENIDAARDLPVVIVALPASSTNVDPRDSEQSARSIATQVVGA